MVATSSFGTSIDTGSFATTGSNTFNGDQTVNGKLTISSSNNSYLQFTSPNNQTGSGQIFFGSLGPYIQTYSDSLPDNMGLQLVAGLSGSFALATRYGGGNAKIDLDAMADQTNPATTRGRLQVKSNGQIDLSGLGGAINLSGSGTIIQGLTYPGTDGTNGQVLTTNGSGTLTFTSVSGSSINTGSFATTGSNVFTGDQTISKNGGVYNMIDNSNPSFGTASFGISGASGGLVFKQSGSIVMEGSFPKNLTFYGTGSFVRGIKISDSDFAQGATIIYNTTTNTFRMLDESAAASNLELEGTFTASLQQGYAWVGNSSNVSSLVATSSFGSGGSIDTGSFLLTASFDNTTRDITFTKGDATTFKLGGFATTGSNTFTGNQTITGSGNNELRIKSNPGNQTNIYLEGGSNIQSYQNLSIGNNGQYGGSGSVVITATLNTMQLAADSGVVIGSTNGLGNAISSTNRVAMNAVSGALVLGNGSSVTTASLTHLSSSANQVNLVFKNNSNTGTTIISGSGNIFTNPNTPTTGYTRYIGGSNNLYLNSSNGVTSQITASAASVSGNRPTMNNNIFVGDYADFKMNQAVNTGTHAYYGNIGEFDILVNAMAFTGSLTFENNIGAFGAVRINAASASNAEIASGLSGSHTIYVASNYIGGGTITVTTNRNQPPNIQHSIYNNVLAGGSLSLTNHSSSVAVNAQNNIAIGTMQYSNVGAAALGVLHRTTGNINTSYGAINLVASASAITANTNISPSTITVTNRAWSGSIGSGSLGFATNLVMGATNTYTISGSNTGTLAAISAANNSILGRNNTIFTDTTNRGNYIAFNSNVIGGGFLIMTGSNNNVSNEVGGAHFGRYNANDGIRNTTGENIFSVGTGTSTTRKTGFLIDSGSNSYFEGTLNVSGSTAMTGSLAVSSFTTLASVSSSLNFADDTAAAAGGVPLGGLYRNGNFVMIRLT